MSKLSPVVLAIACAFLVFVIAAFVLLVINGKDTQGIVTLLTATIFPTLLALANAQQNGKTAAAVTEVQQQVNGNTSALHEQVADLVKLLAASPAVPTVTTDELAAQPWQTEDGRHQAVEP